VMAYDDGHNNRRWLTQAKIYRDGYISLRSSRGLSFDHSGNYFKVEDNGRKHSHHFDSTRNTRNATLERHARLMKLTESLATPGQLHESSRRLSSGTPSVGRSNSADDRVSRCLSPSSYGNSAMFDKSLKSSQQLPAAEPIQLSRQQLRGTSVHHSVVQTDLEQGEKLNAFASGQSPRASASTCRDWDTYLSSESETRVAFEGETVSERAYIQAPRFKSSGEVRRGSHSERLNSALDDARAQLVKFRKSSFQDSTSRVSSSRVDHDSTSWGADVIHTSDRQKKGRFEVLCELEKVVQRKGERQLLLIQRMNESLSNLLDRGIRPSAQIVEAHQTVLSSIRHFRRRSQTRQAKEKLFQGIATSHDLELSSMLEPSLASYLDALSEDDVLLSLQNDSLHFIQRDFDAALSQHRLTP